MAEDTVLSEDEKLATEETAKVEAEQAEESVYKQELAKLQAEKEQAEADKAKAEEIARQKNGTITEERNKRKSAEAAAEALAESAKITEAEFDKKIEEKLNVRDFNLKIKEISSDPDEQALIKLHYETSIVKTGNVETDLARAVAIANSHLLDQAKQMQEERETRENKQANFQGGKPTGRPGKPAFETDPTLRGAATFLDRLGMGAAKKYLGK